MYIFILGILVIVGSLAYIYVVNNKDFFVRKKNSGEQMYDDFDFDYDYDNEDEEEEASPIIYLPDDIEQEKEKRKKRR